MWFIFYAFGTNEMQSHTKCKVYKGYCSIGSSQQDHEVRVDKHGSKDQLPIVGLGLSKF